MYGNRTDIKPAILCILQMYVKCFINNHYNNQRTSGFLINL